MDILGQRRSGILLHPTSLPGRYDSGDLGADALRFIDFLADSGCSVWQMLPLGPTHFDGSPYQSLSAHAGNPDLISLDWLLEKGWVDEADIRESEPVHDRVHRCIRSAYGHFQKMDDAQWRSRLTAFREQHRAWLNDYALFIAIKKQQSGKAWNRWSEQLAAREPAALEQFAKQHDEEIDVIEFEQFVFFTQWHELLDYAHDRSVYLFGDMPLFVSYDSADVWAERENFQLDENGDELYVAGVPPDVFSETGQRWGNPVYDWDVIRSGDFAWWRHRFGTQLEMFDLIRIDHFRGLQASWLIDAAEETAINGRWVETPGRELLSNIGQHFHRLPLIAEDLGLITEAVTELRDEFSLPGMKILQFAFDGDPDNPYLPYNHVKHSVVYTGNHDNDTSLGWYQGLSGSDRCRLHHYLGVHEDDHLDMPWALNRLALSSVAQLAILPMQDILCLDSAHRMNVPGTTEGNWRWRFDWSMLWDSLSTDLRKQNKVYGRSP